MYANTLSLNAGKVEKLIVDQSHNLIDWLFADGLSLHKNLVQIRQ